MITHHARKPLFTTQPGLHLLNIAPRPESHSLVVVPLSQPLLLHQQTCMPLAKLRKTVTRLPVLQKEECVHPGGREGCVSVSSERKVEVK